MSKETCESDKIGWSLHDQKFLCTNTGTNFLGQEIILSYNQNTGFLEALMLETTLRWRPKTFIREMKKGFWEPSV